MKAALSFILLLLTATGAYPQHIHFIKFIHIGIEDKPIGTLIISVENPLMPTDRPSIDSVFGKNIQTDLQTFTAIESFIRKNKYLFSENLNTSVRNFKMMDYRNYVTYLSYKKTKSFGNKLQTYLRARNLDKHVIKAFDVDFY